MRGLFQSLGHSVRRLLKNPGLTLIIALSIGLGIGANTTVFTWMESLVLNPYPLVRDSDRLMAVNVTTGDGKDNLPVSYPTYVDWREQSKSFNGLVAHTLARFNLRKGSDAAGEPVWAEMASGNYFDVLGVPAAFGRTFVPDEERNAARVAVLSHSLWQRRFGGDVSVIGKQILLNGTDVTIIGIAPDGFKGVFAGYGFDLWVPVTLQPVLVQGGNRIIERNDRWLQTTGRLKDGVTREQANEELQTLARRISEANGEVPATGAAVKLMRERFAGAILYPLFSALLAVTALVLLIACANVANLLLAYASARKKEMSIRLALGASRGRIIRQLLLESLLLSMFGGLIGLLFALWAKGLFLRFIPPTSQPASVAFEINGRIIVFACLVTLATAIIFGLVPSLRASKTDLVTVLKSEGQGVSSSRSWLRGALVVAQVAFSLVALVCAGLFLRSLQQAQKVELGFSDPDHVLLATTDFNVAGLEREEALVVVDQLLQRVRTLPGVTAASFSSMVPLGFGGHSYDGTKVESYVPAPDEQVSTERVIVSDGYFETMGIQLVKGRGITPQDQSTGLRVAVVNETFARRYYHGQDALGKRIDQGQGWATIVGVAKDGKYRDLNEAPTPVVYSSLKQRYAPVITLHVRTKTNPKLSTETIRRELTAINGQLPFLDPRTMSEHISAATFVQVVGASMLSGFGILALLLASVGLYGVLSYVVSLRRRELAIRAALGAAPKDVMNLVIKQGMTLVVIGLVIGAAISFAVARLLQSQLLGVEPTDLMTFITVILLLSAVALIASFIPARRAMKVDPLLALRYE
ncbi:MAG TPA: ABC transporter permease [Pyrinomonadaceae bacterium]|nr:ABC transporter permease [Pyrinomonadaceae bacterium]